MVVDGNSSVWDGEGKEMGKAEESRKRRRAVVVDFLESWGGDGREGDYSVRCDDRI